MANVKKPALRDEVERPPLIAPSEQYADVRPTRSAYYPHARVPADLKGVSMTRQEFAQECDVNVLMARFEKTGVWPLPAYDAVPRYFDCSEVPDLQSAMQVMIDAEAAFMSLPAQVRREFDNDKLLFVEFAQKPENLGKMREWGLAAPEVAPAPPLKVEVTNPPLAPDLSPPKAP